MTDEKTNDISFDVAVIGIGCHVPGGNSVSEFWQTIFAGKELIQSLSDDVLQASGVPAAEYASPEYVKAGAFLEDLEYFDPAFFGIGRQEAAIMDPQHRHFLLVCFEALEQAGYVARTDDLRIGLFAGCGYNRYLHENVMPHKDLVDELGWFYIRHTSNDKDFLVNRVAYELNLRGPCVNIQTACSTSLVATHYACSSLLAGECDVALAGGVTIEPDRRGYLYRENDILSRDGHCRAFSADATGTVFGNGAAVVALKLLPDAIADGDHIYGVIKGSAVNNDGRDKIGFFAPGVNGHTQVVRDALQVADVSVDSVELIEAHGTGTYLGDPIEVRALEEVFRDRTRDGRYCALGSVKSQVGHLDTAAGIVSLIKAIGAVYTGTIPPTLHVETENPEVHFEKTPFFLPTEPEEWHSEVRRACVSSLGVGGTNAHVVLENYQAPAVATRDAEAYLVHISAEDPLAFQRLKNRYVDYLRTTDGVAPADFFYSLNIDRQLRSVQKQYVVSSLEEFTGILQSADVPGESTAVSGKTVFLFAGGGAQRYEFASGLLSHHPEFREPFEACARIIRDELALDILTLIERAVRGELDAAEEDDPLCALPFLFSCQYAFARFLISIDVQPDLLLGHSMGEYTAACLAGVFSLEDALRLVIKRAQLFNMVERGSMLSASLSEEAASVYLSDTISLAAINGPELVVFSGSEVAIAELHKQLESKEVENRLIRIQVAAHSHLLEPILDEFEAFVETIPRHAPELPLYSNVSGRILSVTEAMSARYWRSHLRQPVLFERCVTACAKNGGVRFIETGPGKVLASLCRANGIAAKLACLSADYSQQPTAYRQCLDLLGQIAASGVNLNWRALFAPSNAKRIPVPTYPFARERCWLEALQTGDSNTSRSSGGAPVWSAEWRFSSVLPSSEASPALRVTLLGNQDDSLQAALATIAGSASVLSGGEPDVAAQRVVALLPECPGTVYERTRTLYTYLRDFFNEHEELLLKADSVVCVCRNAYSLAGESIDPAQRLIPAFASVMASEMGIPVASVDWSGSPEDLARFLCFEQIEARPYVLRRQSVFVQRFAALPTPVSGKTGDLLVPEGATCLVTGAFGAIGSELVRKLARESNARLVLLGRRVPNSSKDIQAFPARYRELVQELQTLKASVVYRKADLTDPESVATAFAELPEGFERIEYVFHLAGVLQDSLLAEKEQATIDAVFGAKVTAIDNILPFVRQNLKSCVLFSSISSFKGMVGQSDYAGANAVLDAYALYLRQQGVPAVSIAWGPWAEQGMAHRIVSNGETVGEGRFELRPTIRQLDSFRTRIEVTLSPEHWLVADHVIPEIGPVLPGTGIFELILEAALEVFGETSLEVQDLIFLKPVVVKEPVKVAVEVSTSGAVTVLADGQECASAFVRADVRTPERKSEAPVSSRFESLSEPIELDQADRITFGERWNCLRGVQIQQGEACLAVGQQEQFANDTMYCHPASLDVALFGLLAHAVSPAKADSLFAPVAWERACVYAPLPPAFFVKQQVTNIQTEPNRAVLDVEIQNAQGMILAEFRGLRIQEVTQLQLEQSFSATSLPLNSTAPGIDDLVAQSISTADGFRALRQILDLEDAYAVVSVIQPTDIVSWGDETATVGVRAQDTERLYDVEETLRGHPDIAGAVVLSKNSGTASERILAYVHSSHVRPVTSTVLRDFLKSQRIEEHRLPVLFSEVESEDIAAAEAGEFAELPDPFDTSGEFEEPEGVVERYVAASWRALLGMERISRFDSFLDIGGHSLLALRFIQKVRREKGVMLEPGSIIVQNVAQIAELIDASGTESRTNGTSSENNRSLGSKLVSSLRQTFRG